MADAFELNAEQLEKWLEGRPEVIRQMVATHPPHKLYRMTSTGQRVTIYSYAENETVTVNVTGRFNLIEDFERQVFGIPLDDLIECELPAPGEPLGVMLSKEQQEKLLEQIKQRIQEQQKNGD